MARYRAIEPGLWEHPVLRRGGFIVRELYIYLCCHAADDEGRARIDSYSLLEGCFSRTDPVTLQQVDDAIRELTESGLLLVYGKDERLGFLTGWFEHQPRMDFLTPSRLPPPPCEVNSWEDVEKVRELYSQQRGKSLKRTQSHIAVRWVQETQNKVVSDQNKVVCDEQGCFDPKQGCFGPKQALEVEVGSKDKNDNIPLVGKSDLPTVGIARKVRSKRVARTPEQLIAEQDALMERLPGMVAPLVDTYLENAAQANKSKAIAASRAVTLISELVSVYEGLKETNNGTADAAMFYGLSAANSRGAVNATYVRKAGESWTPTMRSDQGRRYQPAMPTHRPAGLIED